MKIPFNKPFYDLNFFKYCNLNNIKNFSSDGKYTKMTQNYFERKYSVNKFLLTSSCTSALEMSALLLDIKNGDEVIIPSYTFSSTANAFMLRGAKIKFIDSKKDNPNLDPKKIEELITKKTKCIVIMHYAGIPCDMNEIINICKKNNIKIVEDAAQCLHSSYKGKALGTFGDLGCISFHETKNISSGEGGGLFINKNKYLKRAIYIRDKGTNRIDLVSGKIDKYGWVDIGSSYAPSDLIAKLLYFQKDHINEITKKRKNIWRFYYENFKVLESRGLIKLPSFDTFSDFNGHIFYILCNSVKQKNNFLTFLDKKNITATTHYQSLHNSKFFKSLHDGRNLHNSENFSKNLIRLPLYHQMNIKEKEYIVKNIFSFFNNGI